MSKIGNSPITVPSSVQLIIHDHDVSVKGSKGELSVRMPRDLSIEQKDGVVTVTRANDKKDTKALHGLFRSLLANAVKGVETPWERRLQIVGTGFNVKMQGEDLVFKIGFSHLITFNKVAGVTFKVEGNNKVIVGGIDKQLVGQVAYQIKSLRKPDPYKGKGIRYEDEVVRLKPGKKAKA
jgi:large subunit ribosomal protein L6